MKHLILPAIIGLSLSLSLSLTACGKKDTKLALPEGTTGLRVTAAIDTGVNASRITVIPNDVAPWMSQILLLEGGKVTRTSVDGGKAQAVNAGNIKDMIGLMRKGQSGTALTLTTDGKLTALIEKDDEGRLGRMNVSSKADGYDGFCQGINAPETELTAFSGKKLVTLSLAYEGDSLITVTETGSLTLPKPITSCFDTRELVLSIAKGRLYSGTSDVVPVSGANSLAALSNAAVPIVLMAGDNKLSLMNMNISTKRSPVVLENGLSIGAAKKTGLVYVTSDSLGGAFGKGAVIVQDAESKRLVLIARPFAYSVLTKTKR